jgi:hypothetical protein
VVAGEYAITYTIDDYMNRVASGYTCPTYRYSSTSRPVSIYVPEAHSVPNALKSRSLNEALLKVKDRAFNLAEAFGERAETAEMILSKLRTIFKGIHALKRGNLRRAARIFGVKLKKSIVNYPFHLADLWMEFHYGWYPFILDIYGALEFLNENDLNRPERYAIHAIRNITDKRVGKSSGMFTPNPGHIEVHYKAVRTELFRSKTRLDYYLVNPQLATLSQLGITNPLSLAWELMTLSWFLDWIIPIGSYLSALDATSGWQFRAGSRTNVTKTVSLEVHCPTKIVYLNGTGSPTTGSCDLDFSVNDNSGEYIDMERIPFLTNPGPELPSFNWDPLNGFSETRVMDIISMMISSLGGVKLR